MALILIGAFVVIRFVIRFVIRKGKQALVRSVLAAYTPSNNGHGSSHSVVIIVVVIVMSAAFLLIRGCIRHEPRRAAH